MEKYHPVVLELIALIKKNHWQEKFQKAIDKAGSYNIPEMKEINNLEEYYAYLNEWLHWIPTENRQAKEVYDNLCKFYFILDQLPVKELQNAIIPHDKAPELTPLSRWIVQYAEEMGKFMDTPESLTEESLETFRKSPPYNLDNYVEPNGGWTTFNQFFARHFKPGTHPVAAVDDPTIIVSPADSTFSGRWEILPDSGVTVKGLHWKIEELLEGSPYKDRFNNGLFMHAFLSPTDYHRQHTPVQGKVLESRFIQGQCYLQVIPELVPGEKKIHRLNPVREFDAPDTAGYQFAQARGLIVIESPIGLVAILPIGMCQISSVIMTAEVGVTLRKGEEISYFQCGGSDIVVLFENCSNVDLTAQVGNHYKMGSKIGTAYPVA